MLDREHYLPKEWAEDIGRRKEEEGVPKRVRFATKIELARRMVERAFDAGVGAAWLTADAVYGSDYRFRSSLEGRGLGYVVGVRAKALLAEIPAGPGWPILSAWSATH